MAARVLRPAILLILGVVWLAPVYLLVVNAAKPAARYASDQVWRPIGEFALFDNLREAWDLAGLADAVTSTVIYSVAAPALAVLIGAAIGFGIVALRLKHGFFWFVLVFGGTIFPLQMILMPLFVGYVEADVFDTRLGLVAIYTAIAVPFAALVMRNFLGGIAHQVFEAAVVDGASTWRIFWRIYLPMSASALVAVFILQATFVWNDLLLGLVLSQSDEVRPLMTALTSLQDTYGGSSLVTVLAGGLLVSLPTVVLFLSTQRIFSRGLNLGQF
ncbi:carbohydrate ABC transporter permease [Jiangella mangrovi]|uniref:Multiple sugar transport system permease protein n=1 Tax=Jiangella mangrovi TaxID=1524084 RepID=A0A7W9LJ93_9ACTN|nr:carbohydrate ABC transporter permease [Jiangella mangrovi]MBB5785876.1 multiple sugar transport system permease protein [Jiangella mangrovi]